jgi:hypothetical protein
MKRVICAAVAAIAIGLFGAAGASAAASGWHSETPVGPGIGVPTPLGEVGDMSFWAPNRGVLIAAGNQAMPAGVYAYDGTGWHRYSTVCGGHEGSIAWAGPEDFWTVSDYPVGIEGLVDAKNGYARTLCHFQSGQIVASYAEPFGSAGAYPKMETAACSGPADCWFAGVATEKAVNSGSFHLHWDGGSLTPVPSLEVPQPGIEDLPGTVFNLSFFGGGLYESATEEPFLREANLARPGVFSEVPVPEGVTGPFSLAADAGQLWAVSESEAVALRSIGGGFERLPLERQLRGTLEAPLLSATEPNGAAIWAAEATSIGNAGVTAVTRVNASGAESPPLILPAADEELDPKGRPSALACPAAGQCWVATKMGWLFHLGEALPQDTDPAMHVLLTSRPKDNSTRTFVAGGVPEDNSGETEPSKSLEKPPLEKFPTPHKRPALVGKVHQKVIGKSTLQLTFTLHARAHVQLLAKFHRKVVAKTPRLILGQGPHKLRLKLDPKRWPTGLDFRVHPAAKKSA